MKFQTKEAFEKHLKEAFPQHPSSVYLVASLGDFERKQWMEAIGRFFQKKGECDLKIAHSVQEALMHVKMGSLLGGIPIAILDLIEELNEQELSDLTAYVLHPSSFAYLILGATQLKSLQDFCDQGKKEMVILDLSLEKSWQKEKRLKKHLALRIQQEGKTLSPAHLDLFFQEMPLEMGIMEQELQKLICYVGDKKEITLEDIRAVASTTKARDGWQLADEIIWKNKIIAEEIESSMLFGLIGQMRYYLEKGLIASSLVEKGKTLQEIAENHADLSRSFLEKYAAYPKKSGFFKKGLLALFQLELSLKSSSTEPNVLLAIFCGKL